ncbi:unnamed protein product [Linum trigynum]|uniref:Uncharacterized protein n=1 Tax=Linum trigynum TaxID=586398 RepID=A0AAV2FAZ2_9ROSI
MELLTPHEDRRRSRDSEENDDGGKQGSRGRDNETDRGEMGDPATDLPLPFRRRYLSPFLPKSLTISQQICFCRLHITLSLGLFQPVFLVTLVYIVKISVKKSMPRGSWAILPISATRLLVLLP